MRGPLQTVAFLLCAAVAGISCDESLPPRVDPEVVLVPSMALSGDVVTVDRGSVAKGGTIVLSVRNVYDEVLSEKALIKGVVTLSLREFPDSGRTLLFGPTDLLTQGLVVGNTLTLRVQQVAELVQPWDHKTPGGTPFWALGLHFFQRTTDKGEIYFESQPVHLVVHASVQLFERVQAQKLEPREFTITYQLWRMSAPSAAPPAGQPL